MVKEEQDQNQGGYIIDVEKILKNVQDHETLKKLVKDSKTATTKIAHQYLVTADVILARTISNMSSRIEKAFQDTIRNRWIRLLLQQTCSRHENRYMGIGLDNNLSVSHFACWVVYPSNAVNGHKGDENI